MEGDNIAEVPALIQVEPVGNTKTTGGGQLYRWQFTLKSTYITNNTINDPIDPESLWKILIQHCKEFYFQLERGVNGGYEHFQGCLSLKIKHRLNETKNIIGFKSVHLEPIINWNASLNYCSKEDTRVAGPWNHNSVWIKTIEVLNWWQEPVLAKLLELPDDRSIWWIWDSIGNIGKSAFCKYAAVRLKATVLGNGSFADLAFALGDSPKIVIFDLPRTIEGRVNYTAIEKIKDGMIFSGKYESKTKVFNSPHVLVFANFSPDENAMSKDRWNILRLDS